MQLAQFQGITPDQPVPQVDVTASDRKRLSGPGLRSFRAIADQWKLSEQERIAVLGDPPRSTYHAWMKKAAEHQALTLPLDTLLRISAVLGVHKAIAILFSDRAQGLDWLMSAHDGTVFRGAAPRDFITSGTQDGIMTVRRYLDALRGGPIGEAAEEAEPVTPEDIVFL